MPHSVSAKRSHRRSLKHNARNKSVKSRLTTETRKFHRAIEHGDASAARSQLNLVTKLLQRAAARGVIHANHASRMQSRLAKQLEKLARTTPAAS
jgi:small subunit ribosomal protein S20